VKKFFDVYACTTLNHDPASLEYARRFPISKEGLSLIWSNTSVKIVGLAEKVKSAASVIDGAVRVHKQKRYACGVSIYQLCL